MSEAQEFKDDIRMGRGFFPDVPLVTQPAVGDGAIDGENVVFSRYSEVRSWKGFSPYNSLGAKLLHNVGGKIGGNASGNVWKQNGQAVFFIGSGDTYVEDFTQKIGVSTSQLQLRVNGQTYQAGLPKPSAPEISLAVDVMGQPIAGQVSGDVSAELTRIRTVTGAESEASDTSNIVTPTDGKIRVAFPLSLADQGQDEWGVYLTRHGFGGVGPHYLYKQIPDAEIAPFAFGEVLACAGNGATSNYGGTTAVNTNSRFACIVLRPAASTLPSYVGSGFAIIPGKASSLRVQRPAGSVNGQYLTVMVTFKATHTLTPAGTNKGVDGIAAVTGVWMGGPIPLNPGGEKINIVQTSQNEYKWKLQSDTVYSSPVGISSTPTQLGSSGIALTWTANSTGILEIGNEYTIDLFSLIAPAGWFPTPVEWQNNPASNIGIGIFGQILDETVGEFFDWTTSVPAQMNALAVTWKDCDVTVVAPTVQSNSNFASGTAHNVSLPSGNPTATQLVTFWFTSDGPVADFTPTAPLAEQTSTDLEDRFVDIDYADDDLLNIIAPRGIEPPPAGTHGFPLGPLTVIAGILDGTGICPSQPNQSEQYDLASNATFLSPAEAIVRCEVSPYDGSVYIWTRNSLQTVVYTGDTVAPVLPRTIWNNTGIAGQSAATITKSGAYCHSGRRGIARYRGNLEPDTNFADPVNHFTRNWRPEDVVVGYDPQNEAVAYCHMDEILVYFETIGIWSTPLKISLWNEGGSTLSADSRIVSCLTIENRLYFVIQSGIEEDQIFDIFLFDVGLGGDWFLRSVARHAGAPGQTKTIRHARLVADFSPSEKLEWYWESSIHQQGDTLITDSSTLGGYAACRLYVPPSLLVQGNIRFEWEVKTPINKERWVNFAYQSALTKYGINARLPTTDYNSSSLLAWRITNTGILEWWTGATAFTKGGVLEGDIIRIEWDATGVVKGYLVRNGAIVGGSFDFGYTAINWTNWVGLKASCAEGGAVLDVGTVYKINQTGGFRLYKNFAKERGLPAIVEKTYAADHQKHYKWERINRTNVVTYNVELFGSCGDQSPSVVYLDGIVSGQMHESLKTQ